MIPGITEAGLTIPGIMAVGATVPGIVPGIGDTTGGGAASIPACIPATGEVITAAIGEAITAVTTVATGDITITITIPDIIAEELAGAIIPTDGHRIQEERVHPAPTQVVEVADALRPLRYGGTVQAEQETRT